MNLNNIVTEEELKEEGFEDMHVAFTDLRIYGKGNQRLMLKPLADDKYEVCEMYEMKNKS